MVGWKLHLERSKQKRWTSSFKQTNKQKRSQRHAALDRASHSEVLQFPVLHRCHEGWKRGEMYSAGISIVNTSKSQYKGHTEKERNTTLFLIVFWIAFFMFESSEVGIFQHHGQHFKQLHNFSSPWTQNFDNKFTACHYVVTVLRGLIMNGKRKAHVPQKQDK